ncbi:MAG: glycosyltransferase family 2 protein [Phycisphaerales bacterium]|nr:glycosyltransferase family 2 protein [Hyphomonadaceae bacterium]
MPYASIIIPTHDRAETLPYSLRSALGQTVHDIEIVIVGDGCTAEVRAVAEGFANADSRVRFLDLPKAPMRGAENRHQAVLSAQSPRIFYNDDDDILLSHHVEVLGAALDDVDVVDTPPVSINLDGAISLGIHNSASAAVSAMLQQETHKGVFDTHLAHTKSAYQTGDGAWIKASDRRVVLHMLKHFGANPSIKWKTVQRATALSFHGMCRAGMRGSDRASELRNWEKQILDGPDFERRARGEGSYVFHGARLIHALIPEGAGAPPPFLSILADQNFPETQLTTAQRAPVEAIYTMRRGERPDRQAAQAAFDDLLEARLAPEFPTGSITDLFLRHFAREDILDFLTACRLRPAVCLGRLHLDAHTLGSAAGDDMSEIRAAMEECLPGPRFFFGASVASALSHMGRTEAAWDWAEEILPEAPNSFTEYGYWMLREKLALALGHEEAVSASRQRMRELSERMT